jgi:hypothetical protein
MAPAKANQDETYQIALPKIKKLKAMKRRIEDDVRMHRA